VIDAIFRTRPLRDRIERGAVERGAGLIDRIALLDQTLVARPRLGIAICRRQARQKNVVDELAQRQLCLTRRVENRSPPRLSCRTFSANAVRLQLHVLAYNLGNFMRTLAMPKTAQPWSLTSLREKLIKIGAKVVIHGRYVTFQMAEVAVSRQMFADILSLIARLRALPASA
jgi:hypothetical protein